MVLISYIVIQQLIILQIGTLEKLKQIEIPGIQYVVGGIDALIGIAITITFCKISKLRNITEFEEKIPAQ